MKIRYLAVSPLALSRNLVFHSALEFTGPACPTTTEVDAPTFACWSLNRQSYRHHAVEAEWPAPSLGDLPFSRLEAIHYGLTAFYQAGPVRPFPRDPGFFLSADEITGPI